MSEGNDRYPSLARLFANYPFRLLFWVVFGIAGVLLHFIAHPNGRKMIALWCTGLIIFSVMDMYAWLCASLLAKTNKREPEEVVRGALLYAVWMICLAFVGSWFLFG